MRRRQLLNGAAVVACTVVTVAVMGYDRPTARQHTYKAGAGQKLRYAELPGGGPGLIDATGHVVPLKLYQRVVAGSIVARSAMGELSEAGRTVGVFRAGIDSSPIAYRFVGVPRIASMKDTERLLSLRADLVIVNAVGSLAHVQRLRDAGIEVFVLGDMRGVESFARDLRQVAVLIGSPTRGERAARSFVRRMRAVAGDIAPERRKTGMYVSVYGAQIFGGTIGTSYHDILTYGGLTDAARTRFTGWPQYTVEHVLSVDPEIIVVPSGIGRVLCGKAALQRLRACTNGRAGIVELPSAWLEDPSMVMLDVAERIRDTVYGGI